MRYLVGFVFVLALGTLRLVGCGDEAAECWNRNQCDDQSVCTVDRCSYDGVCWYYPVSSPSHPQVLPCELEGGSGFCIDGECQKNPCVRDDSCADEAPMHTGGRCMHTRTDPDGTPCEANGVTGVCISYACSEHNPCEGVVCGEPLCTDQDSRLVHYCDYGEGGVCKQKAESCSDGNQCTENRCDPETGDCFNPPVPDGQSCCFGYYQECGGFCIPPCCWSVCVGYGNCNSGVCE